MKECSNCKRCFPDELFFCGEDGTRLTSTLPGTQLLDGRYLLERKLGSGAVGMVYRAQHVYLKTHHAIKVIRPDLIRDDPSLVTRFRQEALAAAAIRHPNVVTVTDFGLGDLPFLVMEFIDGITLQHMIAADGAMAPARALPFFFQIAAAVSAAHRLQIIHRDLKPLNVMVRHQLPANESVKVLDFGLAKIKSNEVLGSLIPAQTKAVIGTPYYMAPEQWSDEESDERTDIYSLGVILYQMLAGDLPFKGTTVPSIMKKHLMDEPPPLASLGVRVSPLLEAVIRHALEKKPTQRPQSVQELIAEICQATQGLKAATA